MLHTFHFRSFRCSSGRAATGNMKITNLTCSFVRISAACLHRRGLFPYKGMVGCRSHRSKASKPNNSLNRTAANLLCRYANICRSFAFTCRSILVFFLIIFIYCFFLCQAQCDLLCSCMFSCLYYSDRLALFIIISSSKRFLIHKFWAFVVRTVS